MFEHIPFGTAPVGRSKHLFTDHPSYWKTDNKGDDEVYYICNKDGYRAKEWLDIDWEDAIIFLGDSVTFCLSVKQNETISSYVEDLTNKTCVNLGINGTSIEVIVQLSLLLKQKFEPKCVVLQYPDMGRLYDLIDNNKAFNGNLGNWTNDYPGIPQLSKDFYNEWRKDKSRAVLKQKFNCNILRHIWKDNNLVEWTIKDDVSKLLNIPTFDSLPKYDYELSRDLLHASAEKNKSIAREITNVIG